MYNIYMLGNILLGIVPAFICSNDLMLAFETFLELFFLSNNFSVDSDV